MTEYAEMFLRFRISPNNDQAMFKKALMLDAWMFPIREEASTLCAKCDDLQSAYFVNCQRFQGKRNLQTMRHFEKASNIITLRDTLHYAPCDIPTVLLGSWLRLPFSLLFRLGGTEVAENALPADKALDVCSDIATRYFTGNDLSASLEPYIESINRYLIKGTSYINEESS